MRQERGYVGFIHASVLKQAKDGVGVEDGFLSQQRPRATGEADIDKRVQNAIREMAASKAEVQPKGVVCEAQAFDSKLRSIPHQNIKNGGMEMKVQMSVNVIQLQACRMKFLELSMNFGAELFAQVSFEEITKANAGGAVGKLSVCVDESRYFFRRQSGVAAKQR